MSDFLLRPSREEDIPALKALWHTVFGDPPGVIDRYFFLVHCPGAAAVAERDGKICGAFHLMEDCRLVCAGQSQQAAYLYALAVLPEARGIGLGTRLTRYASQLAAQRGAQFSVLRPANAVLDHWYRSTVGAVPVFPRRRLTIDGPGPAMGHCTLLSPAEYAVLREKLLSGSPHAAFPLSYLTLQHDYSRLSGGGLLRLEADGALGCAVADRHSGELVLRELLLPEGNPEAALRLAMAHFDTRHATAFLPGCRQNDTPAPGLLLLPDEARGMPPEHAYWGLYWE